MSYPPTPQRKACNCSDPCISTDDVYYAGPNLPNSGINTYNVLTSVIEKLDAIYSFPTLQKVTEAGNYTTLPIIADSFVKIGGTGMNLLLDNGNTVPVASIGGNQNLQQVSDVGKTVTYPDGVSGMVINIDDNSVGGRPGLKVNATESATGVHCESVNSYAILGDSTGSTGVKGTSISDAGVQGVAFNGDGVQGFSNIGRGVYGYSGDGIGVYGSSINIEGIVAESTNGVGIYVYSATNRGIAVYGNGTIAIEANLGNSNNGLVINSGASSTGNPIVIDKNGVDKLIVNQQGELSIVKIPGGSSNEFLMADGSISLGLGYTPVNKAGDTMLGNLILNQDPSTALQAATKQYVDNIVSGINFHPPVVVATDVSLVATYDNGLAGVGATLTGPSVGVLMIDGETPAYLDRILVWQQADPIQNGVYDLTTVGDSVTVYQLTRSSDADNSPPGEIHYGDYTLVLSGDTNGGFGFICNTPGTIDIGITPISYIQFNAAQAVTAGYGLQEAVSNVISIDPAVTQEKITLTTTGSGAATLVSNTLNIPTIGIVSATETGVVDNTSLQELGGVDKTINGVRVGRGNISNPASENTAAGYQALQSVVHTTGDEGYYNTAFGDEALKSLTTGHSSSAFGDWALRLCTTGSFNTGIGGGALMGLTTGTYNVAVGENSLLSNVSGQRNTAVGSYALNLNTGSYNTAIGMLAGGLSTSSGNWNILVGMQAGRDITTGSNNLLIENITNASITSGSYNIVLNPKQKSGVKTGSYNTIIGCWDGAFPDAMLNNVILGDGQGNIRFRTTETGLTTVPGQTNTLIDGDTTNKSIITKEYLTSYTTTQLAGKMNNPSLTASYIPKALTATTIGNSQIRDNGINILIKNTEQYPNLAYDVSLGFDSNKTIAIEDSDNSVIGRDLNINAGRTINFSKSSDFILTDSFLASVIDINETTSDIYYGAYTTAVSLIRYGIYKKTAGTGTIALKDGFTGSSDSYIGAFCVNNSNNDFFFTSQSTANPSGTIGLIKQTLGTGSYINVFTNSSVLLLAVGINSSNGDVFVSEKNSGNVYKQTLGTGSFTLYWTQPSNQPITCIKINPNNGDIYCGSAATNPIYRQVAGSGIFTAMTSPGFLNTGQFTVDYSNGYIYTAVGNANGQVRKSINNGTTWTSISSFTFSSLGGIVLDQLKKDIYVSIVVSSGSTIGCYKQTNYVVGSPNLQGGTLKLNSGTGKGTGASDIELYTGQVLAPGTDMQTATLRAKINNEGLMTLPSVTNALIDADTTGKALVTKEYVNNRLVVETTSGYTLTNADSGGIVIFKTTAAQTLTIPTGLADGFECTFVTLSGVTLTVVSTGNTLNNATSTTMLPQLSFTLKRMLATNTYITAGSL